MEDPVGVGIQSNVRWVAKPHAARSFSYTSHMIQTRDRSEMVKGLGVLNACTLEATVTS